VSEPETVSDFCADFAEKCAEVANNYAYHPPTKKPDDQSPA